MKLLKLTYYVLWIAFISLLFYYLSPVPFTFALLMALGLTFLKRVIVYGEILPGVGTLQAMAGDLVASSKARIAELEAALENALSGKTTS